MYIVVTTSSVLSVFHSIVADYIQTYKSYLDLTFYILFVLNGIPYKNFQTKDLWPRTYSIL